MNANDVKDWSGAMIKKTVHSLWYVRLEHDEHGAPELWDWGYFETQNAAEAFLTKYATVKR